MGGSVIGGSTVLVHGERAYVRCKRVAGLQCCFSGRARVRSLAASRFSYLRGSPLVLTVRSVSALASLRSFEICHLETAVSSALNMLVTPHTRELTREAELRGFRYKGAQCTGVYIYIYIRQNIPFRQNCAQ